MEQTKSIIVNNKNKHSYFGYYELHIDKIEKNKISHPDVAIETCKSLFEGISKTILLSLDNTLESSDVDKLDFQPLFKKAMTTLNEHNELLEGDFVNRASSLIHLLGEIRNKRGDISHGRKSPKDIYSPKDFSILVVGMTDYLLHYILSHFFVIEIVDYQEVNYEDNDVFNKTLDEAFSLDGLVMYSKALYNQDYFTYVEQLKAFESNKEDEQEEVEVSENEQEEVEVSENEHEEVEVSENEQEEVEVSDEISEKYSYMFKKENSEENLRNLCNEENLYINEVLKLIDTYLFDGREPLSSDIVKLLKEKPKLLERADKINHIKNKVFEFIHENINES